MWSIGSIIARDLLTSRADAPSQCLLLRRLLAVDLQEGIIIIAHPVRARAVDPVRVRAARQGIIVVIGILVIRRGRGRAQDRADATRTRTNRTLTDCTVCKHVARPRL